MAAATASKTTAPLLVRVSFTLDVHCPYCHVAKRFLDQALTAAQKNEAVGLAIAPINFKPFMLYPEDMKRQNRMEYFSYKFRTMKSAVEKFQDPTGPVKSMGKKAGLDFSFMKGDTGSSFDALRLIRLAEKIRDTEDESSCCSRASTATWSEGDLPSRVADEIMHQYFEKDQYVGDWNILREVAKKCGIDADEFDKLGPMHPEELRKAAVNKGSDDDYLGITRELRESLAKDKRRYIGGVPLFQVQVVHAETKQVVLYVPEFSGAHDPTFWTNLLIRLSEQSQTSS
jgi:predicted DsbA family dithiol-disulfide isomerase